ncbi:MAG: hypothetical protein U1D96_08915 [Eubacteriales bacterium]|nr:hypothetical protein [Bacillota bacterium]MDQ7788719.1 hypothetical protein [Clostridia bacterium]MDZ4043593.1 hypothetical protein [Eubacteriales bacterium]MDZ7609526.1 hypothetical protein [Eubacteriales bacterium]
MGEKREYALEEPSSEIMKAVREAAPGGKMTCTLARKLAADFGVPPRVIGRACDRQDIKIHSCELGCF